MKKKKFFYIFISNALLSYSSEHDAMIFLLLSDLYERWPSFLSFSHLLHQTECKSGPAISRPSRGKQHCPARQDYTAKTPTTIVVAGKQTSSTTFMTWASEFVLRFSMQKQLPISLTPNFKEFELMDIQTMRGSFMISRAKAALKMIEIGFRVWPSLFCYDL